MEVDAIEEGKLVRVSEEYAKREGLLIIRKKIEDVVEVKPAKEQQKVAMRAERRPKPLMEEFRRPLNYLKNDVLKELKENFQWDITRKRREKNISRHTLALTVGVSEDEIISLEHGLLPKDDFHLISNVEAALGINLRREKTPVSSFNITKTQSNSSAKSGTSDEIEILDISN